MSKVVGLLALVFGILLPSMAQESTVGTSVVIFKTPDSIVIAADSRVLMVRGNISRVDTGTYCKIRRYADAAVVAAGLVEAEGSGFSVARVAELACSSGGTIFDKFARFDAAIGTAIAEAWSSAYPDSTNPLDVHPLDVAFCGMYDDHAVVLRVRLTRDIDLHVVKQRLIPTGRDFTTSRMILMGQSKEILERGASMGIPISKDINRWAIDFVAEEVRTRKDVGGPIDALRISNEGMQWIQRKPECRPGE